MRNRTSITKWNIAFHFAAIIIAAINGLLIVPIYLKFIEPNLFGAWLATGNILVWLTIIEPGVGEVIQQKVSAAVGRKELRVAAMYITSGILISLLISLVLMVLSLVFQSFIGELLNLTSEVDFNEITTAFQITAIGTGFTVLSYAFVGANQGLQSSVGIGIIFIVVSVIAIIVNLYLLKNGYGLISIAIANLIRGIGICLGNSFYLLFRMKKFKMRFKMDTVFFKDFSKLFSVTFLSKLTNTLSSNLDLIIVSKFVNSESVTLLEMTRRPIRIIQGLTDRISVALMPSVSNLSGEGDISKIKEVFFKFFNYYMWVSVYVILVFVLFNRWLLELWLNQHIFIGNFLNIYVCILLFLTSLFYNISNFTFAMGNIKGNSFNSNKKSVLYIFLVFILGKYFGIAGVVTASLLAILFTDALYIPKRLVSLLDISNYEMLEIVKEFAIIIALGLCISSLYYYLEIEIQTWVQFIYHLILYTIAFYFFLYLLSKNFKYFIHDRIAELKILVYKFANRC